MEKWRKSKCNEKRASKRFKRNAKKKIYRIQSKLHFEYPSIYSFYVSILIFYRRPSIFSNTRRHYSLEIDTEIKRTKQHFDLKSSLRPQDIEFYPCLTIIGIQKNLLRYLDTCFNLKATPSPYVLSVIARRIRSFNELDIVKEFRANHPNILLLHPYEPEEEHQVTSKFNELTLPKNLCPKKLFYSELMKYNTPSYKPEDNDSSILLTIFSKPQSRYWEMPESLSERAIEIRDHPIYQAYLTKDRSMFSKFNEEFNRWRTS